MTKKMTKKRLITWGIVVAILLAAVAGVLIYDRMSARSDTEISAEEAQNLLEETLNALPLKVARTSIYVVENCRLEVTDLRYGSEKDIRLTVSYETPDVLSAYQNNKDAIFADVWRFCEQRRTEGKPVGATNILVELNAVVRDLVEAEEHVKGTTEVVLYDVGNGEFRVWLTDETVDTLLGGYITVRNDILATDEITVDGETVSIRSDNSLRNGISDCFGLNDYRSEKPDTSTPLRKAWNSFADEFYHNFIQENRWTYLVKGLGNTLAITGLSLLIGVLIGFLTAIIRCTAEKSGKLKIPAKVCSLYITVVRGTPVMVQLLIIYFVLLLPIGVEKFPAAVLCFGFNSGAYVSEIIRGGILAVDNGQMEAGRSLGFGFVPTMFYIVIPQAFKAVLPSLCNEFIALLKETSIAFYIGVADLTQGGLKIRSITYSNFMPLLAIALIYLVVVLLLTQLVGLLERRLRRSER